jgi:threonyl-tRNA synthetase
LLKEIERRDHRTIAQAKRLFSFEEEGLFWYPAGVRLRERFRNWWSKERAKAGFQEIKTPASPTLTSFLPNHAKFFLKGQYKERELPVRFCEWGKLRFLKDEEVEWRGLLGVSPVTADLACSFCLPEALKAELTSSLQFLENGVKLLGFRVRFLLTLDDKYLTRPSPLEKEISAALREVIIASGCEYAEESVPKLCSFGPQITVFFQDSLGRDWPLGTLGVASALLPRLQSSVDKKPLPLIVWSQLFVSLERFIGVFLEQSSGAIALPD